MIEGFRIDVTAEEIVRHLDDRIGYHHERAAECESKAKRLESLEPPEGDEGEDHMALCWPGYMHELEHRAARHRSREVMLIFFRDRVVANEVYRLGERDLRSLEWLPIEEGVPSF